MVKDALVLVGSKKHPVAQETVSATKRRPAAFFDRDGVLNRDSGYVHRIADLEWLPGAREAIKRCNDESYLVFVVTNQSGIARGYYDEAAVAALHEWMRKDLERIGARIDDFRYCPHLPGGKVEAYALKCSCRKPAPGMLTDLIAAWNVDKQRSFLIGDRVSDIQAATAAGCPGYLFRGGNLTACVESALANSLRSA